MGRLNAPAGARTAPLEDEDEAKDRGPRLDDFTKRRCVTDHALVAALGHALVCRIASLVVTHFFFDFFWTAWAPRFLRAFKSRCIFIKRKSMKTKQSSWIGAQELRKSAVQSAVESSVVPSSPTSVH